MITVTNRVMKRRNDSRKQKTEIHTAKIINKMPKCSQSKPQTEIIKVSNGKPKWILESFRNSMQLTMPFVSELLYENNRLKIHQTNNVIVDVLVLGWVCRQERVFFLPLLHYPFEGNYNCNHLRVFKLLKEHVCSEVNEVRQMYDYIITNIQLWSSCITTIKLPL